MEALPPPKTPYVVLEMLAARRQFMPEFDSAGFFSLITFICFLTIIHKGPTLAALRDFNFP